jgi:long-chain fatty acid transport protein
MPSSRVGIVLALGLLGGSAQAGGLANSSTPIGARARGTAGAFCGLADDATALYYNPAGLVNQPSSVLVGGSFGHTTSSITPDSGKVQSSDANEVAPTLGYVLRPTSNGHRGRVAIGVGLWRTFGAKTNFAGASAVTEALYELTPGFAYDVSDVLQVGAALRLGLGLSEVSGKFEPIRGSLSAKGLGFGASLGLNFTPIESLRVSLSWRSGMNIGLSGSGSVGDPHNALPEESVDFSLDQRWPQSAALAAVLKVHESWHVAVQADWSDWSTVDTEFRDIAGRVEDYEVSRLDLEDTVALRLGVDGKLGPRLELRAGYAFETQSIPDGTEQRDYTDGPSHTVALGGSYAISPQLRVDLGAEARFLSRNVPADTVAEPFALGVFAGDYKKTALSLELAVVFAY